MKIACIQMDIAFGEPEENFRRVEEKMTEAVTNGAEVIVLPEMWNTGYALTQLEQVADRDGKALGFLSDFAKNHGVYIVGGSVSTKKEHGFTNTMHVVNNQGEAIAEYDKAHLFGLMDEHIHLKSGESANLFEVDGVLSGGVICYDIRFPEWLRRHALEGAKVLFVPAEWPAPRVDHWRILLQARAIENQCFVVAVNRVGSDPANEFGGHSMIIAPWGEVRMELGTGEEIGYAEIALDEVDEVRGWIPVFDDRRENIYRNVLKKN